MDQQQQYKAAAVEQLAKNYALKLDGASTIHAMPFHHLPHNPQPTTHPAFPSVLTMHGNMNVRA
jgi:hypothetical protein